MKKNEHFPLFKFNKNDIRRLFFIAGPCVIESEEICRKIAGVLANLSQIHSVDIIFKASYDKANRTSQNSFRGPGKQEGLLILDRIRRDFGLPVLTDVHEPSDAEQAAQAVDILQIPAFLCRQTDLLVSAGKTGKWVNVKKGQFMSPEDMQYSVQKAGDRTWLTERGTFFGYNRLVVDFTGIPSMKKFGKPIIFDATHSVQLPGGAKGTSGGNRELALPLAKAALSMGVDGLFFEIHPDPDKALCDGPNSIRVADFEKEMPKLLELHALLTR